MMLPKKTSKPQLYHGLTDSYIGSSAVASFYCKEIKVSFYCKESCAFQIWVPRFYILHVGLCHRGYVFTKQFQW